MKNEDKKDEESEDEEEVGAKYQNPVAGMFGHSQIGGNPSPTRPSTRVGIPDACITPISRATIGKTLSHVEFVETSYCRMTEAIRVYGYLCRSFYSCQTIREVILL